MAANPWHPRLVPFLVYVLALPVITWVEQWSLHAQPVLYAVQVGVVVALLWRYRRLLPELTLRFHWLALPVGVGLCAAWVVLGHAMIRLAPAWFAPGDEAHVIERMPSGVRDVSLGLRLIGMGLVVPMFEELFVRSGCLRGLHSPRKTWIGLTQMLGDLPGVGDWMMQTGYGRRIARYPAMFTHQLRIWPVGKLTLFGVAASTAVFMVSHTVRDWPGAIVCGVAWCALVWWTNRPGAGGSGHERPALGLGPVIWSHALTNVLLWGWCVWTGEWFFL